MERDNPSTRSMSIESTDFSMERRVEEPPQPPSPNALKVAATECLNSWITYLQVLNSLCSAGVRLAQSLTNLSQQQNIGMANNCLASWDEFAKSTVIASHTVKTHIAAAMQDMSIGETFTEEDSVRQQEHNQQIIAENLLTFINLQYQFSIAGCECFGALAMCPSCHTTAGGAHETDCTIASLQQCFSKLYAQEPRSQTSSPHFAMERGQLESPKGPAEYPRQISPSNIEGRVPSPYQEGAVRGPSPIHSFMDSARHVETIRGPLPNPGQLHTMKMPFLGRSPRSPLHFPLFPLSGQRRWSEAAAGAVSEETGDGTMRRWSMPWDCGRIETAPWQQRYLPSKLAVPSTQDRSRSTTPDAVPQPLTITRDEGLAEAIQLLSCRPSRCAIPHGHPFSASPWGESHEERMHRRMFQSQSQRGNWQSIDVPPVSGMSVTEHYDIFPPGIPLTSRKSSSSTDSSSCLSIHSRSTSSSERGSDGSGPPESMRMHTNIYSIWSGNEHLPFIRLPESQEPPEDSEAEENAAGKPP